ncbi:DNA alkylation repair protein [Desulfofalx alkaliphila]|uniref:DNA alkylation repair protein n=1 Tax=Desulfofalx alkaliphila TaxID=105483 RepID=UPI0004E16D1B|nr:DNA alkylation repair protein [Desulfofalx alkaliphila]
MYEQLINKFYDNRNQEKSKGMSAYMKNKFPFLGIQKPRRAELAKDFIKQAKKEKKIDWNFVFMLWDLPEREFQYLALDYILALKNSLEKPDIDRIKLLVTKKSWWDTVDNLAKITGVLCAKHPELVQSHILSWAESNNIWLARIAILFQLNYKEKTNTHLLSTIINKNSKNNEFFIAKAIGWALREYSKTNKEWVKSFLESHPLQPLSVRVASKYL